jgi:hypothetical protein
LPFLRGPSHPISHGQTRPRRELFDMLTQFGHPTQASLLT